MGTLGKEKKVKAAPLYEGYLVSDNFYFTLSLKISLGDRGGADKVVSLLCKKKLEPSKKPSIRSSKQRISKTAEHQQGLYLLLSISASAAAE